MQYFKRLVALMLVFFGWKSLQAQPLPTSPAPATPATANQSGAAQANPQSTNLVISPPKAPAISAEQEQKVRALLEQATAAAVAADSQAKPGAIENKLATTPAGAGTALDRKVREDADRDRELARIEAAVEEARKRREAKGQTLTPSSTAPAPTPSVAVTPAPAPVSPAAPAPALAPAATEQPAALKPATGNVAVSTADEEKQKQILSLLRAQVVVFDNGTSKGQSQPAANAEVPNSKLPPGGVPATAEQTKAITPLPAPLEPRGGQPNPSVASAGVVQMAQAAPGSSPASPPSSTPATLASDKEAQARELLDRVANDLANKPPQAKDAGPAPALPAAAPAAPPVVAPAPAIVATPPPGPAAPATQGALTPDKEMQARELLEHVSKEAANKPPQGQEATAIPATAPNIIPAQPSAPVPIVSTIPVPASPVGTMTAEKELKARNLLNQAAGRSTMPAPIIQPPPSTVVVPPQPAPATTAYPVVTAPGTSVTPRNMAGEKEARARELLMELRGQKPASFQTPVPQPLVATPTIVAPVAPPPVTIAPPPAPVVPPPVTTAPVPIPSVPQSVPVAPPSVVVTPPPTVPPPAITQPAAAIGATPPSGPTMTPEQEMKARELLWGASGKPAISTAPAAAPPTTPTVTPPITGNNDLQSYKEARKRAEQDAKLRKKAEDKARKEMERMQAETRAKAKEDLRRKAEAEARARKETEATVASVRTKEREDFRKRSATAPGDTATVAPTVPENSVAVAKAIPSPEVKSTVPAPAISEPKKTSSAPNGRPEEDPAFPAAKRQQLIKLLNDYRQDKITPEEYHSERAKIIAAP